MNRLVVLSAFAGLGLVACETMNTPVSSGEFDPLSAPGAGARIATAGVAPGFRPGQFVRASMDNTGFYRVRPRGDADADRLLGRDTPMKVVSADGSYARVELDSGEVGFVPTVMLEDSASASGTGLGPSSAETQVYPPVIDPGTGGEPLPYIDPSATPPADSLPVAGGESETPAPAGTAGTTTEPQYGKPLPPGIEEEEETTDQ